MLEHFGKKIQDKLIRLFIIKTQNQCSRLVGSWGTIWKKNLKNDMWTTISTWVIYYMLVFWRKYGEQVEEQFGK
jgi:hypothetical protein